MFYKTNRRQKVKMSFQEHTASRHCPTQWGLKIAYIFILPYERHPTSIKVVFLRLHIIRSSSEQRKGKEGYWYCSKYKIRIQLSFRAPAHVESYSCTKTRCWCDCKVDPLHIGFIYKKYRLQCKINLINNIWVHQTRAWRMELAKEAARRVD